jgi:glycosyltransferase involved in cell wall biosynthesis
MRICFVSRRFFPAVSGMSVYAANLLRELVEQGHDVTLVSQYRDDPEGRGVYGGGPPPEVSGVRVIGLEAIGEREGGDFERDIREMVETIVAEHEREPFDVIHAQYGYPTGLAALKASVRTGVPNVVSIQGGDGHWVGSCCGTHARAMQAVLGHAGALLIGSRSFADEVHENHGVPPDSFTIIPGAVDTRRFHPAEENLVGLAGQVSGDPVLLYHGRVDARKGVLDLLRAMSFLQEQNVDRFRLVVSGIGPDVKSAKDLASDLGLDDRVEFTGYAPYEETPGVYREADVFVSPTHAEGFSNTILEAMATGLPVVSTNAVGVVDCLTDGDNALLVEPGDHEALAAAIARVLNDPGLRRNLAKRALSEARDVYAWPAIAGSIEEVYRSLAGTSPDTDWSLDETVEPCRFREAPHLL